MTPAIQIGEGSYLGWRALWLRGPGFALALVPEVGGRIMGIEWRGRQLAFANPDLAGRTEQLATVVDVRARKRALGFPLWGGDKTWLAPQARWTDEAPFLDLDSGAYEVSIEDAPAGSCEVRLTSPVCRESSMQIERCIRVAPGTPGWQVTHELRNCSSGTVAWAPWIVAMFRRLAQVFLPTRADSTYPDGVKTYADEGESRDVRSRVVTRVGDGVRIDCTGNRRFKFGTDAAVGTALAVLDLPGVGRVGIRKQVPIFHPVLMRTAASPRSSTAPSIPTSSWSCTGRWSSSRRVGASRSKSRCGSRMSPTGPTESSVRDLTGIVSGRTRPADDEMGSGSICEQSRQYLAGPHV